MNFTEADLKRLEAKGYIRGYKVVNPANGVGIENEAGKLSKFGSKRTEVIGIVFASKKEACRFSELLAWQRLGIIHFVNIQVRFKLSVCEYWADFAYLMDGELIVEDVKSKHTKTLPVYRLKKKLMFLEKGIKIKEA